MVLRHGDLLCWLVLLSVSWRGWLVKSRQDVSPPSQQPAVLRRLLTVSAGNITLEAAEATLRRFGIDAFGPIVYMARTPTCALDALPASARAQLFTFCRMNAHVRACRREDQRSKSPGERKKGRKKRVTPPLFHLDCRNGTCIETLPISSTACVLRRTLNVPAAQTVNTSCMFSLAETSDSSQPFTPVFLQPVGKTSVFDCVLGLPPGSAVTNRLACTSGFFRAENRFEMGGEAFLPPDAEFRCAWDGRCRDDKGCCDGEALFEGYVICYLPKGQVAPPMVPTGSVGSATRGVVYSRAAVVASLVAVLIALS